MKIQTQNNSVPAAVFRRMVLEIIQDNGDTAETVSSQALSMLQEATEDFIVGEFINAYVITKVAGRSTLHVDDLHTARAISHV